MTKLSVEHDVDLTGANTLALSCRAQQLIRCNSLATLQAARDYAFENGLAIALLGGGSNSLCREYMPDLVVKLEAPTNVGDGGCYTEIARQPESGQVTIEVAAGVSWAELVSATAANGLSGLENLAAIPGSVGAAPIQNIGAYGVEIAQCLQSVQFYYWGSGQLVEMNAEQCEFGYRESIFKRQLAGQGAVVSVQLQLLDEQCANPAYNTAYPALAEALNDSAQRDVNAGIIAAAVTAIRQHKLPDPTVQPNAGSFFKNPVVDLEYFQQLQSSYPEIPCFSAPTERQVKIPAAWLLEQAGLKGYRHGAVATHALQPLVLVNQGGASLQELLEFADHCAKVVEQKFAIKLQREPQELAVFEWPNSGAGNAV